MHFTLDNGSYVHYQFSIDEPAVLDCAVDSLPEEPINVILTTHSELERFRYRGDSRYLEKGTEFNVSRANIRTRLTPAEYTIIIDNTGRVGDAPGASSTDIEIEYEVRA